MIRTYLVLLLSAYCQLAQAHQQSLSYSHWQETPQGLELSLRHSKLDLNRAQLHPYQEDYLAQVSDRLAGSIQLSRGGADCEIMQTRSRPLDEAWIATRVEWRCAENGSWQAQFDGLLNVAPDHNNLASWRELSGQTHTRVFNQNQREWTLANAPPSHLGAFLKLGIEHILQGWDHLAFLLALILLLQRSRELIWLISGFTLAHSLTLSAVALQWSLPNPHLVEIVIALSIVLTCLDNTWRLQRTWQIPGLLALLSLGLAFSPSIPTPFLLGLGLFVVCYGLYGQTQANAIHWQRAILCIGFGLFHGFGFGAALNDMQLAPAQTLWALLGFNLGVELGQLIFVLPLWAMFKGLPQALRAQATPALNAGVAGLASYWLVLRLLS